MKKLLLPLLVFFSFIAEAQYYPTYTRINGYYDFTYQVIDSFLIPPADTLASAMPGAIASINDVQYLKHFDGMWYEVGRPPFSGYGFYNAQSNPLEINNLSAFTLDLPNGAGFNIVDSVNNAMFSLQNYGVSSRDGGTSLQWKGLISGNPYLTIIGDSTQAVWDWESHGGGFWVARITFDQNGMAFSNGIGNNIVLSPVSTDVTLPALAGSSTRLVTANSAGTMGTTDIAANMNPRTAVADANHTVTTSEYLIAYTSLTAARVVTLPAASTVAGHHFILMDEAGTSGSHNVTISGTVNGVSNPTALSVNFNNYKFYSNGTAYFKEN